MQSRSAISVAGTWLLEPSLLPPWVLISRKLELEWDQESNSGCETWDGSLPKDLLTAYLCSLLPPQQAHLYSQTQLHQGGLWICHSLSII